MRGSRTRVTLLVTALVAVLFTVPAAASKGGGGGGGGGKPTTTTTTTTTTTVAEPTTTTTTVAEPTTTTTTAAEPTTTTTSTTTTSTTLPANVRDPILFVHGWNSNETTWDTMVARFQAAGYAAAELNRWSYNTSQSNKTTAQEIAARVEQIRAETGADQVDVIAHSMGSLSSRWYVKFLNGHDGEIDAWVSLGGPNHGTDTANWCFSTACSEMRIGSAFLKELNAGDESPGDLVRYATWWSPCDSVINPDSSVAVGGATNTQTACIGHSDLHQDATVFAEVAAFIEP